MFYPTPTFVHPWNFLQFGRVTVNHKTTLLGFQNLSFPMEFRYSFTLNISLGFISMDTPLYFTPHVNLWAFLALQNVGSLQVVISTISTIGNA